MGEHCCGGGCEDKKDNKDDCCGGDCDCSHSEPMSKEEQVKKLGEYKKALEEELKAVDNALKELK